MNAISSAPLGIGSYTAPQASRLTHIPVLNINRWLGGYSFVRESVKHKIPPLWTPQFESEDSHLELGFRDLIELRFVSAFLKAGLGLLTIRNCLCYARELVDDDRPFSTRKFQTDGRTIFLDSASHTGSSELLDLKNHQYVIKQVIERTFKDLDLENEVVVRWRPLKGKQSIIIDPTRSFGQPIAAKYGVPTSVLADAVKAEGSITRAASLYEVSSAVVRDAIAFERSISAA